MFHISSRHVASPTWAEGTTASCTASPVLALSICLHSVVVSPDSPSFRFRHFVFVWFSAIPFSSGSPLLASSLVQCYLHRSLHPGLYHRYMFRAAIMRDKQPPHSATAVRLLRVPLVRIFHSVMRFTPYLL